MSSTENNATSFSYVKKVLAGVAIALVLVITIVSFIVVPAFGPGGFSQGDSLDFGKWNGSPVSYSSDSYFYNLVMQQLQQYENFYRQMGQEHQFSKPEYQMIFAEAYNSAILRLASQEATTDAGLVIPTSSVDKALLKLYTDPQTGKYSQKLYDSIPAETKLLVRNDVLEGLAQTTYVNDIFGIKTSSAEKDMLLSMATDKRDFSVVSFPMTDYPRELYSSYGANNTSKFVKYNISLITADTESKAKDLLQRVKNNELTFEDATSISTQVYSNEAGLVVSNYRFQLERFMQDEVIELLSTLQMGQLSDVVSLGEQFGFIRVNAPAVQPDMSNTEVFDMVKSYVDTYEKTMIQEYFVSMAKDFAEDAKIRGLEAASKRASKEVAKTGFISLNYANTQLLGANSLSGDLSGFTYDQNLLKTAFALKKGDISEPVVSYNNVLVVSLTDTSKEAMSEEATSSFDQTMEQIKNEDFSYSVLSNEKHEYNFTEAFNQLVRE